MLRGSTNEEIIWNFLRDKGLSASGTAGLMGNLYAESALNPTNLQNSYERSLGYADRSYTAAVDSGAYKNFVHDQAGYGLAQWTYYTRKAALLQYAKSTGCSIGDLEMQLGYLFKELSTGYATLLGRLKSAKSVRDASDAVLTIYERPADMSERVRVQRASFGQKYYDKFSAAAPPAHDVTTAPEPVAALAFQIGDIVNYSGSIHYASANAVSGISCTPGKAKVTAIYGKGKHPYHLIAENGGGGTVYGWVDADKVTAAVKTIKAGMIVRFKGGPHYGTSSAASASGHPAAGRAKVTRVLSGMGVLHPYHIIHTDGESTVFGWVDEDQIEVL